MQWRGIEFHNVMIHNSQYDTHPTQSCIMPVGLSSLIKFQQSLGHIRIFGYEAFKECGIPKEVGSLV